MSKYKVSLNRTVMDNCEVIVEAKDTSEAWDKALDGFMGEHDWQNPETIDISVAECEEVTE